MKKCFSFILMAVLWLSATAQDMGALNNQDVVDMISIGLTDEIVISKIKASYCDFDTSTEALKELKDNGVSNAVIVSMINAGHYSQTGQKAEKDNMSGIYYESFDGKLVKIHPTVFSGSETNTLASAFSYGIASSKMKSFMPGSTSKNIINSRVPRLHFFFRSDSQDMMTDLSNWWFSAATSPNQFVLVRLEQKKNRRELVTGKINLFAGVSNGISEKDAIGFSIQQVGESEFLVRPTSVLSPGEYCFFYMGAIPVGGFSNQSVFDFSIPLSAASPARYEIGDKLYVILDGKIKKCTVGDIKIKKDGKIIYSGENYYGKSVSWPESDCSDNKDELKSQLKEE